MRSITFLVAVLVAPFTTAAGQLTPGDFVRVRVGVPPGEVRTVKGHLVEISDVHLVLAGGRTLSRDSVTAIETSVGTHDHGLAGFGIGLVAGVLAGVAIDECALSPSACRRTFAAFFGAVGGVLGLLVGRGIRSHDWEPVAMDQLRLTFAPQRDGRFTIGLSVAF